MHNLPGSSTVAVIGAGPSGLAAARKLVEVGFDVTVFERKSGPGGTWVFDSRSPAKIRIAASHLHDVGSHKPDSLVVKGLEFSGAIYSPRIHWNSGPCYQSLMTNVKTPLMKFDAFEYPKYTPWFVPHYTILRYLEDFSKQVGVDSVTRYDTNVSHIEEVGDGRWNIRTQVMRPDHDTQCTCCCSLEQTFDKVVVCTGHFDNPHVPLIPGLSSWISKWPESILHSKEYRNNRNFRGKNVLIVGAGSSAYDIGREVSSVAHKVCQIVKKKPSSAWSKVLNSMVPENMFSFPEIAVFGNTEGISHIKDGHVVLNDGSSINGLDHIIFCTGYRFSLPFLPDYQARELDGETSIDRQTLITDGVKLHNLHKDMFFIPQPTLTFIGVPFATFPFLEMQADTIAAVFSGAATLPNQEQMYAEYRDRESRRVGGGEPYTLGVDGELAYVRETQSWSINSADQVKLRQYEQLLKEAEKAFPEALARYLRSSNIVQSRSAEEVERVIISKVEEFKLAEAMMK